MKTLINIVVCVIISFIIFNCKTQKFQQNELSKRQKIKFVKKSLELSKTEYELIKNQDTFVNSLYASIKAPVKTSLINRRLDSFTNNNYTKEVFIYMLSVDRFFKDKPNIKIERLPNPDSTNSVRLNSLEEVNPYLKGVFKKLNDGLKRKDSIN